jgi:hypothetical protein
MINSEQEVNEYLWRYGYPWATSVRQMEDLTKGLPGPIAENGDETPCPKKVLNLSPKNPVRRKMLALAQEILKDTYLPLAVGYAGKETPIIGESGPATFETLSTPRCGCPDFAPPKLSGGDAIELIGAGPWKGCHEIGQYHAAHIKFTNSPPSHLNGEFSTGKTVFQEALRRTRECYREIGLMLFFSGSGTGDKFLPPNASMVQSNASFVGSSAGWIGLAIVGNNSMSCNSGAIWARFLQGFASSSGVESKAHAWHLLLAHEFGHNCGSGHTSGGIMNPSLNTGSNGRWIGDVAEGWMKGRFGGAEVPDNKPFDWWDIV